MERRGISLAMLSMAVLAAAPAAAQDAAELPGPERYGLRLQYLEFRPGLSGEAQKASASRDGSVVDVDEDLGLEDKRTFDVRGAIQFKRGWKLRGAWSPLEYDGDREINRGFDYGETRYNRFDRVRTSIRGNYFSADLEWDFMKGSHGFLGVLVGARMLDVDANLVNVSAGFQREVDTVRAPIPVIGVATRLYAGRISFQGELAGLSAGERGSALDAEGSLRLHLSDRLAAVGGYRHLSVDGKDGDDRVKLKLGGWQFGLEVSL
jgi:hypothetical protein